MILPRLVPSALALLAGLLLSGCPSSVRVESARTTTDATPEVDAADAFEASSDAADVPVDLPDGDGHGDVTPEIAPACTTDADCADLPGLAPCRAGRCLGGTCEVRPVPGCCTTDADCVAPPEDPCFVGVCLEHACAWKPRPDCCQDDAQCNDGDPCTRDSCHAATGACAHQPDPACGGCVTDADCDDGDPCTDQACDYGLCEFAPVPGCCALDAQCDDGDPCTQDRCQDGACAHQPDPACGGCASDADCKDADACTVDACVQQACLHEPLQGCSCHVDADCADANPCTKDRCQDGQCAHVQAPDCCQHPLDCSDGNACTWDLCTDNTCYSYAAPELPGCCASDADCPANADPCQVAVCRDDFHCALATVPGCCAPQVVLTATFDADAPGWTLAPANKPARWSVDPHRFQSAPAALYFGNPNTLTYAIPGQASAGTATTPLLELPEGGALLLRFALWLDVETQPNVDRFGLRVLEAGSATVVWNKTDLAPSQYRAWTDVQIDLAAWAGHAVRLQFAFDTVDALDNGGEGVVVDDLDLRAPCGP